MEAMTETSTDEDKEQARSETIQTKPWGLAYTRRPMSEDDTLET